MAKLEAAVRGVAMEGLTWGEHACLVSLPLALNYAAVYPLVKLNQALNLGLLFGLRATLFLQPSLFRLGTG